MVSRGHFVLFKNKVFDTSLLYYFQLISHLHFFGFLPSNHLPKIQNRICRNAHSYDLAAASNMSYDFCLRDGSDCHHGVSVCQAGGTGRPRGAKRYHQRRCAGQSQEKTPSYFWMRSLKLLKTAWGERNNLGHDCRCHFRLSLQHQPMV